MVGPVRADEQVIALIVSRFKCNTKNHGTGLTMVEQNLQK
jgi:hypothetical protein